MTVTQPRDNYQVRRYPRSVAELVEEFQSISVHLQNRVRLRGVIDDTRLAHLNPPLDVGDLVIVRDSSASTPTYNAWLVIGRNPTRVASWSVTVENA